MNKNDIVVTFEDKNEIVIKLENKTFLNLQKKTVAPLTEEQVIRSDSGYEGLKEVIIEAVTSAIDSNIIPSNIKKNITILGVEGTLDTPEYEGSYEITSNGTYATSGKKMTQDLVVNVSSAVDVIQTYSGAITAYAYEYSNITSYSNPNTTSVNTYAFAFCTSLKYVKFMSQSFTSLNSRYIFDGCLNLEAIILNATSVVAIHNAVGFSANVKPTIYVPSDLIESYKVSTNWSTLYNNGYIDFRDINEWVD